MKDKLNYNTEALFQSAAIELNQFVGGLKTVEVEVGGRRLPFIIDTAAGITCLTPEVASDLKCEQFGRRTGFRASGERIDMVGCGTVDIKLGGLSFQIEPCIYDVMSLLRNVQLDIPEVGGVIVFDLFENMLVTFDVANKRVILESQSDFSERVTAMHEAPVRLARQSGGAALDLFLGVEARQGTIWLEVDIANLGPVVLNPHSCEQLGVEVADGSEMQKVPLTFPGIGEKVFDVVVKDLIYDGLLNTAFLESVEFAVDFKRERAWIK